MADNKLLNEIDLFVLDMDGTFYLGDNLIEGSLDFLRAVEAAGKRWMFFTNNSSKDKQRYVEKLDRLGCKIDYKNIFTSGDITIAYLKSMYKDKSVYLVGTPVLEESFLKAGIKLVQDTSASADIVVIAFDMTLTYEKLEHACTLIREGAIYLATHPDINCPVPGGFIPDCGAFIAAINLSTGKTPKILGKPYSETADMIAEISGIAKSHIAFVGDRLYTDVACGINNGAKGILVLSGETKLEDLASSTTKPDLIYNRIYEIGLDLAER